MGVYVPIEIPSNCVDCELRLLVGCNPYKDNGLSPSKERHRDCPLVEMVEPKQGEWIEDYNNVYSRCRMKCSVCGKFSGIGWIESKYRKPYCPNCGAKMKGENDETDRC